MQILGNKIKDRGKYHGIYICVCGNLKYARCSHVKDNNIKSCGCLLKKNKGPSKKFMDLSRRKNKGGYIYTTYSRNNRTVIVSDHVLVVEKNLGRPLIKGENVHHINGVRDDNRIENLELWNHAQPIGQRLEEKIQFYIDFLKQYGYTIYK